MPTHLRNDECDDPVVRLSFREEFVASTDLLFQSRLTWLLILGPLAILGQSTGILSETICFAFSGIALIPCAERLSFVTEQVAEHTNGTIGALLNATFGNAPELLLSISALRAGFYRVVQLAMLGSMLTNMLLVFGVACMIGGLRFQVQELRITSGNSSVLMLYVATAGALFPAALKLASSNGGEDSNNNNNNIVTRDEVIFSRLNAFVMFILYGCYLVFQLGTHKEEFDDDGLQFSRSARRNLFCMKWASRTQGVLFNQQQTEGKTRSSSVYHHADASNGDGNDDNELLFLSNHEDISERSGEDLIFGVADELESPSRKESRRRRKLRQEELNLSAHRLEHRLELTSVTNTSAPRVAAPRKAKNSDSMSMEEEGTISGGIFDDDDDDDDDSHERVHPRPQISMRVGVCWLMIITLCISAMSEVLVETIDGFAKRMHLSEVFTSMVIIPFFSNIAEQVSAFIFAFRNEMDLCIGVTVGSAIQIATMVLPGSVIFGMLMGRSMTLYFHAYETIGLFFGVVVTGAILQGGTTNWLTGAMLVGIYIMLAGGIWFHELEDLSVDGELAIQNMTAHFLRA